MQIAPRDLSRHLESRLAPVYLVAGDEPLLVQEACDAVLAAAAAEGYTERSILYTDAGFHWQHLLQDAAALSLFAERRITDLRVQGARFDREASECLRQYTAALPPERLLLIRSGRLDAQQRKSAWFKALDQAGVVVLVWPVSARELPGWLRQRLAGAGLELDAEAERYFLERIEGNLLAAVQEIRKMRLLDLPRPISVATLAGALDDQSRYDTFELLDSVMAGDAARVSRMVRGLRAEGASLFGVLAALTSQLRRLHGDPRSQRLPPHKARLLEGFRGRLGRSGVDRALAACALVDAQGKGQLRGDAWLSVEALLLGLAGCPAELPPLAQQSALLRRL